MKCPLCPAIIDVTTPGTHDHTLGGTREVVRINRMIQHIDKVCHAPHEMRRGELTKLIQEWEMFVE